MILFFQAISHLINLLPRSFRRVLGSSLGLLWYYAVPFRKEIVQRNIRTAMPELSSAEVQSIARDNFVHYGRSVVEILASFVWSAEKYRREVPWQGIELALQLAKEGKGGYFLTCHLGNWEVLVGAAVAHGLALDIVVKRARSAWVEKLLVWYRKKKGVGVIVETGTAREIMRSVSSGRFVGFMLDQFMGPPIGLPVKFFGIQAGTPVSLALLTDKNRVPILPGYCYRDAGGRIRGVIEKPVVFGDLPETKEDRLYVKTQAFNDIIEKQIRQHPAQWLWLHRRWKEFRGTPRWLPSSTPTLLLGIFFIAACSSTPPPPEATSTGIAIPPDPQISVPQFKNDEESFESLQQTSPPVKEAVTEEVPVAEVKTEVIKPKNRRKKPEAKVIPPKEPEKPKSASFEVLPAHRIPFEVGERMELALGWAALPAGTAVLEVRKGEPFVGRNTYLLWGNVLSSKLVDAIYHVDNTIESFVDTAGFIPYKFLLHMTETQQLKETRVSFDHTKGKAYFWAERKSKRWGDNVEERVDELIPQAKDMFSGLFYARTLTYTKGQTQKFRIYENGKNWEVELTPVANEVVTTKAGAFQCWKLSVNVKLENVLKPTGDIFMWLSDDSKRYLVKFEAKIKIGSLYGNMVNLRERQ